MITRPMLAAATKEEDLRAVKFPVLISAKLDGIRALCIRRDGKPLLVSRKFIEIPNRHTQHLFAREEFIGLDGELCVGPTNAKNLMQATNSGVMSVDGEPAITWQVFDSFEASAIQYCHRAREAKNIVNYAISAGSSEMQWLSQYLANSYDEMCAIEERFVSEGYEGAIIRSPHGPYKQGRSTVKQGYLLKIKWFADGEAEVLECIEQETNNNETTLDNLGYTKRSSHAGGKAGAGILGSCIVRECKTGIEFQIGTGWTREQRTNLWAGRKHLPGKIIKYKHFPIGVKNKPRFPIFISFRDRRDM